MLSEEIDLLWDVSGSKELPKFSLTFKNLNTLVIKEGCGSLTSELWPKPFVDLRRRAIKMMFIKLLVFTISISAKQRPL